MVWHLFLWRTILSYNFLKDYEKLSYEIFAFFYIISNKLDVIVIICIDNNFELSQNKKENIEIKKIYNLN